jgi:hypothetical protein
VIVTSLASSSRATSMTTSNSRDRGMALVRWAVRRGAPCSITRQRVLAFHDPRTGLTSS